MAKSAAANDSDTGQVVRKIPPAWTPRLLEIFVAVAHEGSMSAAASRFGLTQPAISQAIAALEKSLGFELFDRTARPPVLTLRGKTILAHANDVTHSISKLEAALERDLEGPFPLLRIGMLNSFAGAMGPLVINRLRDLATEWSVTASYSSTRLQALADRRVDFVITSDQTPPSADVEIMPILSEPYLVVTPKGQFRKSETIEALAARLDLIKFGRDPHVNSRLDRFLQDHYTSSKVRYQLDTIEAAMQMISAGLAWSLLTPLGIFRTLERGDQISATPLPGEPIRRTICLAVRRQERFEITDQIHHACVDALRQEFLPAIERALPEIKNEIQLFDLPARK